MDIVYGLLLIVGLLIVAGIAAKLFTAYPVVFLILWIAIPIFTTIFRYSKYKNSLSKKSSKWIRIISVSLAIWISFCTFANYDKIRDEFGHQYIKGYYSDYYQDVDDYGRPARGVIVLTSHWIGKFILWLFEWLCLILCVAIPAVAWKQCSVIYDKAQDRAETKI